MMRRDGDLGRNVGGRRETCGGRDGDEFSGVAGLKGMRGRLGPLTWRNTMPDVTYAVIDEIEPIFDGIAAAREPSWALPPGACR
jgi:hypothetical protein